MDVSAQAPLILRAAARVPVRWKNGGGITREVAAHPPASDLDSFAWRVSLAEVSSGGPFSAFPGVDRRMAVLAGTLALTIAGRALELTPASAPVSFDGEAAVSAEPQGGPVTDLNVMTRRGRFDSRLSVRTLSGAVQLAAHADAFLVIALAHVGLHCNGTEHELAPFDAARFDGAVRCQIGPRAGPGSYCLVELRQV